MKKYVNTWLYAKGGMANSEGYQCFDVSTYKGKRKFVKEFGIGTVLQPRPKKYQKIPKDINYLNKLIYDIVEFMNESGHLMFFSNTKNVKKEGVNKYEDK